MCVCVFAIGARTEQLKFDTFVKARSIEIYKPRNLLYNLESTKKININVLNGQNIGNEILNCFFESKTGDELL